MVGTNQVASAEITACFRIGAEVVELLRCFLQTNTLTETLFVSMLKYCLCLAPGREAKRLHYSNYRKIIGSPNFSALEIKACLPALMCI